MNLWNQTDVPHKGWRLKNVIDIRGDGESVDEAEYETCMMCNNERIRFVHIVTHIDIEVEFRVGCVCAEKMTNDYIAPSNREKELKNRSNRWKSWINKQWSISKKGNPFLKLKGHLIIIYKNYDGNYKVKIDEKLGNKIFFNIFDAKIAAFKGVEWLKEKGEW